MTAAQTIKNKTPLVSYQFSDTLNAESLNNAFDILFEETFRQYGDLTAMDN